MAHLAAVEAFRSCDGDGTLNFFKHFGHFLQQISLSFGRFLDGYSSKALRRRARSIFRCFEFQGMNKGVSTFLVCADGESQS
jgi:hypothetical protein